MNLRSSTITANRLLGTRMVPAGSGPRGPMVLRNTIIAGNIHDEHESGAHSPDCFSGYVA